MVVSFYFCYLTSSRTESLKMCYNIVLGEFLSQYFLDILTKMTKAAEVMFTISNRIIS